MRVFKNLWCAYHKVIELLSVNKNILKDILSNKQNVNYILTSIADSFPQANSKSSLIPFAIREFLIRIIFDSSS